MSCESGHYSRFKKVKAILRIDNQRIFVSKGQNVTEVLSTFQKGYPRKGKKMKTDSRTGSVMHYIMRGLAWASIGVMLYNIYLMKGL